MRNSKFEMRNQIAQRIRIADQEALNQSTFATHHFRISNFAFRISYSFRYPINVAANRLNPYVSMTFCLNCSG